MVVALKGGQRPPNETDKLVVSVHGKQGRGKTAFALTFPPPLFVMNCDRPAGFLLEQLPESYDIMYEAISLDVDTITPGLATQYLHTMDALVRAARAKGAGTFICDGWDIFWEYVKVAKLPNATGDPLPREFADANAYMDNLLRRLSASPLHVVLTSLSGQVWEGAKKETTKVKREGWKHSGRWITHEVYLFSPEDRDTPQEVPTADQAKGQTHSAYIAANKLNETTIGAVVGNLTFKLLYRMTFGRLPDGHAELWTPKRGAE